MGKLGILAIVALIVLGCYVIYEVWHVFGVWAMILSAVVNSVVGTVLTHLIGCKTQTQDGYTFNPKELPKYLAILVAALVGAYLYSRLGNPNLSGYERKFGILWIILVIVLPILFEAYKLFRDRNDYVKIAGGMLSYRDNNDIGEMSLQAVKKAELAGGDVKLTLHNGQEHVIKTSQMNFRGRDLVEVVSTINESLPNPGA